MRRFCPVLHCLVVLGAAALSGCYSYVPVEKPAPGSVVRIRVPVRQAIPRPNQPPDLVSIEGILLDGAGPGTSPSDSLFIQVESRTELTAFRQLDRVDTVRVDRSDLAGVDLRVFSRPKTFGLTAVIVGATVALAAAALDLGGGHGGDLPPKNGTGSAIIVRPIFSALLHALGR